MGKVLEKIIARQLGYMVGKLGLVPKTQFGGQEGSSSVDPILEYVEDVQAAHNHGLVTSMLTFDISGFFDNVNHSILLKTMRELGLPLPVVKWTATFLSERQAAICLDGI